MHAQLLPLQLQTWLLFAQFSHRIPRVPVAQALSEVPEMHLPLALQHPVVHVLAVHEPPLPLPLPLPLLPLPVPLPLPLPLPLLLPLPLPLPATHVPFTH